jgi:predicted nuclease of predicted toxin-antitoxin system
LARDPGDAALLRLAADESRVLVTIDTDFGRSSTPAPKRMPA